VKAADIDGDGDLDILVANIGAQTLGQTLDANNAMFINEGGGPACSPTDFGK
jgi:hypothetical protein